MLSYMDDAVLLAEYVDELQAAPNAIFLYCKKFCKPAKPKLVVFDNLSIKMNMFLGFRC